MSGPWRALEMAAFAVVFTAGVVLTMLAVAGPREEPQRFVAQGPVPGPIATSPGLPLPPGAIPPEAAEAFPEVNFTGATSEVVPPASGCTATITYIWDVDPDTVPPGRLRAVIRLDGPTEAGEYRRPVRGGQIRFAIQVGPVGVWTAEVVSVDGAPTFPTPLPVTLNLPGC